MGFLVVSKKDTFRLVFQGDPAIKFEGDEPGWVAEHLAEKHSGETPDVLLCRPLGCDEVLRVVNAVESDASLIVYAAALGVKAIHQADGQVIEKPEKIREVLNHAENLQAVTALAQAIFSASREGADALPFRSPGTEIQ
tara:strand:+ start:6529 stop:6945 length:417 start_codon:yes stop_codon:yes gene_type:complete